MSILHISLAFTKLTDPKLDEFASNVYIKMSANAVLFTNTPFAIATLTTAQTAFHTSLTAITQGGTQATADKKAKRLVLEGLLRQLAFYIQGIPGITQANALLSGFQVNMSGSHPQKELIAPVIQAITNNASTQLAVKLKVSPGATAYEFRVSVNNQTPVHAGIFPSTRGIILAGLVPGTNYAVQARAVGGSSNFSVWSDPVSHMAT